MLEVDVELLVLVEDVLVLEVEELVELVLDDVELVLVLLVLLDVELVDVVVDTVELVDVLDVLVLEVEELVELVLVLEVDVEVVASTESINCPTDNLYIRFDTTEERYLWFDELMRRTVGVIARDKNFN